MHITLQLTAIFFAASVATTAIAKDDGNVMGVNAEMGLNGNYGIVGAEAVVFPAEHFDLHGGVGVGASAMAGGGLRFYSGRKESFFFKHCDERYFIGATYSNTLSTKVTTTSDSGEREYRIPRTSFVNLSVGDSTVFFGHLNAMLHLGYKLALKKTEAELVRGVEDSGSKKVLDEQLESGPQVSVSLGFAI